VKHDIQVVPVSDAFGEINHVHNSICFLQQVEPLIVLFLFDESDGAVVQLLEHNWDLVLGDLELLVIVLVEGLVLI
jgi:hypothetical protein